MATQEPAMSNVNLKPNPSVKRDYGAGEAGFFNQPRAAEPPHQSPEP